MQLFHSIIPCKNSKEDSAHQPGYMARNQVSSSSKGGEVTMWALLQDLKDFNTCGGQDHGLQQVGQGDDALHHVSPVHQHQAMDLEGAGS